MKVAIPTENGEVFQHFGQTNEFTVFEIENHIVIGQSSLDTNDISHGQELSLRLSENDVNLLICGGIGSRAIEELTNKNIEVLPGTNGKAVDVIIKYLSGEKIGDPSYRCNHHHHVGHHHNHK